MKFSIKIFLLENGKSPYLDWIKSLDGAIRARISARIARFEDGNFGDFKSMSEGVLEARFFFGSGYRVYFSIQNSEVVLLLTGGDKSTQETDIELAKKYLHQYLEDKNAHKKS